MKWSMVKPRELGSPHHSLLSAFSRTLRPIDGVPRPVLA